ncbi:MAG: HAMP domain-containing sensor histidine kinase [Gammaproteobacteria bacterium]|nr:HAMP domain-containing sensor histidine kinase [Gammaproteobacteria bacterium]MDE0650405.1 HAMP domain-containing sensor histidine kinase [Gammaproteobacteria bacterium]MXW10844.1 HAMP domain-containing histidine kinase [Gammaproteobacteria bacterium]MYC51367.1 HAMP domain-containing histidine kinase [Gammaproteobacteria bacterium]
MPLRRLYVLVLVAFAVIFTAASSWMAFSVTDRALEDELDDKLQVTAGVAAETGLDAENLLLLRPGDEGNLFWTEAHERLRSLVDRGYVDAAWIIRRQSPASPREGSVPGGQVTVDRLPSYTAIVSTESAASLPIIGTDVFIFSGYDLSGLWENGSATSTFFEGTDGRSYKYGFARLEESDEESDLALAVLMRADYLDPLARLRRSVLLASAITVVLSALVAIGLAARIAKPLERLSRVALRIQRGRITRSVEVEAGVEIGRLSRAMERMRLGIIQRDEQLRLMLAQVAHEIRNPLGGLKLFSAIAADSADPQERAQLFRKIQAEVDALNSIITDFLVYARPRAPQPTLHDIRGPLREAAELVATELESRGGSLEVDLPDAQLEVVADSGQVKRMVLNLLRNAAEAGDRVWLKGAFSNGEVIVSVRDNGPGVPESLRGRIFQPFVTSKERGAGLGLAIVAGVARAHDGRVELVSGDGAAGNGAEFRLYLPGSEVFPVARSEANGR